MGACNNLKNENKYKIHMHLQEHLLRYWLHKYLQNIVLICKESFFSQLSHKIDDSSDLTLRSDLN